MQSDDIPNTDIGFWLEYYVEVNGLKHCVKIYLLNLQSYLLNIAIIHLFSTTLDTQKQTTKHLLLTKLHTADTSKILTTTQRPFFFTKGNVCGLNRSAAGGREGGFGINFAAEGGGWAGQRLLRDLDLSQSQPSPCQHVCTGVHALSMLHANMMLFNYSTSCTAMLWSILVYYYKPE